MKTLHKMAGVPVLWGEHSEEILYQKVRAAVWEERAHARLDAVLIFALASSDDDQEGPILMAGALAVAAPDVLESVLENLTHDKPFFTAQNIVKVIEEMSRIMYASLPYIAAQHQSGRTGPSGT